MLCGRRPICWKSATAALRRIYGLNSEVDAAFGQWVAYLATCDGEKHMIFGRGDPNQPDSSFQYWGLMKDLAAKAALDGENSRRLRRMAIVFAYTYWDVETRASLAALCGRTKSDIKHPAFGDLNKLRQAVVHANGRIDKEMEVMSFLNRGDLVDLSTVQFHQVFKTLMLSLNEIGEMYFGLEPGFEFDRKFQAPNPE